MVEARRVLVLVVLVGSMGLSEAIALTGPGQANIVAQPSAQEHAQSISPSAPVSPPAPITPAAAATEDGKAGERPLPDIPALMHAVEMNQRAAEAIEKDYLYRSLVTEQETDAHGGIKKTETGSMRSFGRMVCRWIG